MPTVMLAAIAFRGIHLARVLRDRGLEVIEVYPGAAYRQWGVTSAKGLPTAAEAIADRIECYRAASNDERDAITAAFVSAHVVSGRAIEMRGVDGAIWLPGT